MKLLKKIFISSILVASSTLNFAFDWPQNEIMSNSFFSYFGQLRGGNLSPSLVFSDTEVVKAADKGRIIALISEHSEGDIFESTLGNAVILGHDDDMMTVYANLDSVEKLSNVFEVEAGTILSEPSISGWQERDSSLEFQVVDLKNKSFINPRILMPRFGDELELSLRNITAVNKAGISYTLSSVNVLNSGLYLIYNERQDVAIPYKTMIFINGVAVENIVYDTLYEVDGRLNVKGKNMQPLSKVYPDSQRHLLGEISIPKGHNELTVVVADILGKEYHATYIFDAR